MTSVIEIIKELRPNNFSSSVHGISHWNRVYQNGVELCKRTGANVELIELFSFFHDSCRESDGNDSLHGERAAKFITGLQSDGLININSGIFLKLLDAVSRHCLNTCQGSLDVKVCFDADRLDLDRDGVNLVNDPKYLCTDAAREILKERSSINEIKKIIRNVLR